MSNPDPNQLPRIFQANLARLFERVILTGMNALTVHEHLEYGEAATLEQFLDRAAAQVDNYTANEAAKAYTLTLAAVFERQMSVWARALQADFAGTRSFEALLKGCAGQAGIELAQDSLGADLMQMFTAANVVRHGDGPACQKLQTQAPELWDSDALDYFDLLPGAPVVSEQLRIRKPDLVRYIKAATRFWGLADPLPMAVTDYPYREE
ncbi:hypothetical protein ACFPIF_19840 [Brevundimonas faecalis]|uniref:hypothetical protein n=1 Tax=Brevundimonas faecalis TaxID=947378 RepID=UPI0036127C00